MPRGDRTGPLGYGPRTGRGLGICGFPAGRATFAGRGFGVGRGVGFGRRFWPEDVSSKGTVQEEISLLEERLKELKSLLKEEVE